MAALSIHLPDNLAKASQKAAAELGVSRTQFIRQAIAHELENYHKYLEQEAMAEGFLSIKSDKDYLRESGEIENNFNTDLQSESDEWWKGKKS